jgi:hypothetical protein
MLRSFASATQQRSQKVTTVTVSAPTGGWNARDALGAMDPQDAVTLQNWWPGTNSVLLRNGYTEHATGLPGQVETLMVYSGANTEMYAVSSGSIYDVTTAGAVGAAVVSGLTNSRWQYTNISTSAGTYIVAVNGTDPAQFYNGSTWEVEGSGAPYDWTGVNSEDCNNILLFKTRIWVVVNDSLEVFYAPVNSIGGAFNSLQMKGVMQKGGYIVAAMNWTLDAGYGMDDYIAFISNKGEVAVWQLTDPTTVSGISLIGVYTLGAPVGKRCFLKYGGDLLIITQDGVVPMSGALQSSRLDPRVSITNKIQFAMSQATSNYSDNFGWQLLYFPKESQLYLNVPIKEGSSQQQYVQNNITKSWCNFIGWNANCWEILNDHPYFGANTTVNKAWQGQSDNNELIEAFGLQSFQTYGDISQKQCKMIRYHFLAIGFPNSYGNVNVDYDLSDTTAQLSPTGFSSGIWGASTWDDAFWGFGLQAIAEWQTANYIGYTFAPILKVATIGSEIQWVASDLVFEVGGVL